MQIKPRLESFKIVEQYLVLKDDTGNDLCLTLLEVKLKDSTSEIMETPYQFWCVIGKRQERWSNKLIVSFESYAYWKNKKKKLFKDIINGFEINEI